MICHRSSRSRRRATRSGRRGFTLMEVLLVLAILVILGATAVFSFTDVFASSKIKAAKVQIDSLKVPITNFYTEEGNYPQTLQELSAAGPRTGRIQLEKPVPLDPWGNQYQYEAPQDPSIPGAQYRVWSNGPNSISGDNDDITNLQ